MLTVYKPQGLTPLQTIEKLKETHPLYEGKTISYAGRLDPMAEGLLLLLIDEENKERKTYEGLEKTYVFELLLGVSTDTYDLLGLITKTEVEISNVKYPISNIQSILSSFIGKQNQPYPPYSSKPVNGKPLYAWARAGRLNEITIPEKEITITSLSYVSTRSLSPAALQKDILERIQNVSGNFRQQEIRLSWQSFFDSPPLPASFSLHTCEVTCTSGTYVRSIAQTIGEKLGCGALAYSIKRTRVGEFTLGNALNLEAIG